eukprot:12207919-Alexandrium_andersonii.AAC.1
MQRFERAQRSFLCSLSGGATAPHGPHSPKSASGALRRRRFMGVRRAVAPGRGSTLKCCMRMRA